MSGDQTVFHMIAALAGHMKGRNGGSIRISGGKWRVTAPKGMDIRDFYAEVMVKGTEKIVRSDLFPREGTIKARTGAGDADPSTT
jgi:hypothetical protein